MDRCHGCSTRGVQEPAGRHLYSSCSFCRSALNSPMMSFSFFFSAAVMAVRVRSLLEPTPQPCQQTGLSQAYWQTVHASVDTSLRSSLSQKVEGLMADLSCTCCYIPMQPMVLQGSRACSS